jgi:TolB-like protein
MAKRKADRTTRRNRPARRRQPLVHAWRSPEETGGSRPSVNRRAAVRQSLRRSGAGFPRRRSYELTTSLGRITNFVIPRNTALTFKSKPVDAKATGKELSVRY